MCFVHRENIIAARVTSGMKLCDAPCLPYSLNYLKRPLRRYNGTSRYNTLQQYPRRNCYTFKNLTNNLLVHSHYSLHLRNIIFFTLLFTIFLSTLLTYLFTFAWPRDIFHSHSHSTHGHVITQMWRIVRAHQGEKWYFFSSCAADGINILTFARYNF